MIKNTTDDPIIMHLSEVLYLNKSYICNVLYPILLDDCALSHCDVLCDDWSNTVGQNTSPLIHPELFMGCCGG